MFAVVTINEDRLMVEGMDESAFSDGDVSSTAIATPVVSKR